MSAVPVPFAYGEHLVRSVTRDGQPWFVGKDVCGVLGVVKHHQALAALDEDERGTYTVGTPRGDQEMIIISEPGVYRLIFTSRKKEAEAFKRWMAHEVLPTLRREGRYSMASRPDRVEPIARRQALLEQASRHNAAIAPQSFAAAVPHLMPPKKTRRFPDFHGDFPVRERVIALHRQTTLKVTRETLVREFGPDRSPSISAIQRYWAVLDGIKEGKP